jgi:hypothetical protein
MERVHLGVVLKEQEEVLGWVELAGEGWVAPEQAQAQQGSASVPNAELWLPMKLGYRASTRSAQNAGQKW